MKRECKKKPERQWSNGTHPTPIPKVSRCSVENKVRTIALGKEYYKQVEERTLEDQ